LKKRVLTGQAERQYVSIATESAEEHGKIPNVFTAAPFAFAELSTESD